MSERAKDAITVLIIISIVMIGLFVGNLIKKQELLEKENAKSSLVVDLLDNSNKELKKSIELKQDMDNISEDTIKDNLVTKQEHKEKVDYIQTTTKTKIKQVYQKANTEVASMQDKDKIAEIVEQRNKEVSKLRITSLWKSYCLDEPQEQECAGVV